MSCEEDGDRAKDRCILTTGPDGGFPFVFHFFPFPFSFSFFFSFEIYLPSFAANRHGWQWLIAATANATFSRYAIAPPPVFNALRGTARWLRCYYSPMKREMQPFTSRPPRRFNAVIAYIYAPPPPRAISP